MNNKIQSRSINPARWLVLAVGLNLALLLLATPGQAAIAIQDGSPLTYTYTASAAISKSFTVTAGASVLVVLVEDRSVNNAEPATINWLGGQTLTRDVQSSGIPSTTRGLAMYHLYNPTPGTTNIVATVTGASGNWVTAYTLSGVDTTIAPIVAGATSGSTSTTTTALNINVMGVPAGAWAAVNACWGNTPSTSAYINVTNQAGVTINSTTVVDGADNATTAAAGYVSSLTAGTNIFTAGYTTGGKFVFAVEVFSPPTAPSITGQPQSQTIFSNGTPKFSVTAVGSAPLSYQWFTNSTATALSNGGNISGATTNVLTIANATLANAGNYLVVITNSLGSVTSSVASLAFTSLSGAYETCVMTNGTVPFAYYSFSETADPSVGGVVVQDSIGTFSGTYGVASQNGFNGIAGPRATADGLVGFPDGNTALGLTGTANSVVTLPAFNLNNGVGTNVLTITAWIHPNGAMPSAAGVVFCRNGVSTISGIAYYADTTGTLGYNWNNDPNDYNWNSGLQPPIGVWSMVALVVTSTNATLYVCNTNNGVLSSTHVIAHAIQKFDGATMVGYESFATTRIFNGSIDAVGLFNQALTPNQVGALFSAGSGIANFPPTIAVNPTWTPASVYVGQSASITVNAGGSAPVSYQWQAGAVGSGIYTNLVNGGNISGANSAKLTITNVQDGNYLDYVVLVNNPYGAVTSTVPATLTVMDAGPATTFTLNYNGPVQQGIGADWNSINAWSPLGLPASTSVYANPGSTFEVVVGSRMRNPQSTTYNVFPGNVLQIDGDSIFENSTVTNVGEIRFKDTTPAIPSTNYFPNLVLNGGQLNIGDSMDLILQGAVTVATNSTLYALGTGTNQTFRIDSYLTGGGAVQLYLSNSTPAAALVITGTTNTFTGRWNIVQGPLVGIGVNSLGTNTITIGKTNGILESSYPINNPNGSLILNGKMFLTQNDTFKSVYVNGLGLAPGTYLAATLSASYPSNFPATFAALSGTTATTASGQITVLANGPPIVGVNPTWKPATIYVGQTASNTISGIIGTGPFSYQWMAGSVGSGVYTDLANGGNISGADTATLTITSAQLANYLDYVVRISNASGVVTSTVPATLTINDSAPFVVTDTTPVSVTSYVGTTATFTATFAGSLPISYQWVTDGGSGIYTNIPGATNSTLVLSNVQLSSAGNYYLNASNSAGGPNGSSARYLTVNDSAPFIVTNTTPANATYYPGSTATFTAAFDGSRPIAYQWVADGGSGTFTNIPGATNIMLVLSNVQAGSTGQYYVNASNLAGGPVSSSPSTLTVIPSTYAIHFGATNAITTADAVLNHPGVVAGAAVFGGTAKLVTLGNGSSLTFTANGSVATATPGGTGAFAYPAPNTTGNTNFDAVLNQCSVDSGPKTITLTNLVAGHNYSVLLIGLDARGTPAGGGAPARFAYFQDPVDATDVSSTFQMGQNVYVMASFLAQTTTQKIIEQLPTGNTGNMNALVVYDLSAVITPPTLGLAPSGGGNLTLTWSAGSILLQTTNLAGPWTTNSTATSPYTVLPTNAQSFFRVQIP